MSRHRLAYIISKLLMSLPQGSLLTIAYSLSEFVDPPADSTPILKVGEITESFSGSLGDLTLPTSVIFGLGYEKNKALGVYNMLDSNLAFAFIPQSPIKEFETQVIKQNEELLKAIPNSNLFYYNVSSPYSTYVDLKSLILSLNEFSRPLIIPLGPKILSALCVILGMEFHPNLPIWRVSSEHHEEPTERPASGEEIVFTIEI